MKKILSIILAILMIVTTIPMAFAADSDGVKTELDISKGKIVIADSYVTLNEENVEVDPDGYIITGGSVYQDTALKIINNSGEEKTLNIVFKDLYISSMDWATAFRIDGNSPLTLNILLEGSTYIAAHNHAAIEGSIPDARVNFTTTEGSSLKLCDQFGGETSAFSYGFIVSIDGKEVGPDLHIHEYVDGVQSCRGYLCSICDEYFGEKDESLHESNGVQGCRGYFCYICDSYYGESGPHKKDWQSCIGWFCNDCQEFNYPDEGDENKHNWIYGKCSYCNAKFPEDAECLHDWDYESQCRYCGIICEHTSVVNFFCNLCNNELPFSLITDGTETYCSSFYHALEKAEDGSIIRLNKDTDVSDQYYSYVHKNIIFDLNGYEWDPNFQELYIYSDVKIMDSVGGGRLGNVLRIYSPCTLYDGIYDHVSINIENVEISDLIPDCCEVTYESTDGYGYYSNVEIKGNHSFSDYKQVIAPKCGVEGIKIAECDNGCGMMDVIKIDAIEHSLVLIKTTPAGCGVPMVDFYNCEFCCDFEVAKPKFGTELFHSFTKYEVTEEAKCGIEGKEVAYCDNGCGATDEKAIEALKHSFTKYEETEAPKCGIEGKKVAVCDNGCGATDEKAIEALKHDIVIDEAVAPKCGESGLTQGEHCTRCDYKVEQEVVPALKHSFTKYEVTEEAKCGVEGKEAATCDNGCGATDEKAIAALTHKDADGDYKCDNGCGHEFEKPAPEEPTPDTPDEPADDACDHLCHKSGILGFFWKIVKFFSKLFKANPVCECGAAHY